MKVLMCYLLLTPLLGLGQVVGPFPGPPSSNNTTAIHKDSSLFMAWADSVSIIRGLKDISDTSLGYVDFGLSDDALNKADGNPVSLGDAGEALFVFIPPIQNHQGSEIAIFENSFSETYLELAFVEISSDGQNFFRFPSVFLDQNTIQTGAFGSTRPSMIHNFAGKYPVNYGTPFDFKILDNIPGLDINAISHLKVIDVIGTIDTTYSSRDSANVIINDPYPTAFSSGGFDLDALGILRPNSIGMTEYTQTLGSAFYPNPSNGIIFLNTAVDSYQLYSMQGELICSQLNIEDWDHLDFSFLNKAIYILILEKNGIKWAEKLEIR